MPLPPNTLVARLYFGRGATLWIGARALLSAMLLIGGLNPVRLTLGTVILVIAAVIVLGAADLRRRHERPLLENLGLSRATSSAFFALPALLGEIVIRMATAMLT